MTHEEWRLQQATNRKTLHKDLYNVNMAQYAMMVDEAWLATQRSGLTEGEQAEAFRQLRLRYSDILNIKYEP